jgi:hypothetical protein
VAVDPFEAEPIEIDLVQCRLAAIESIQIGHVPLHTLVRLPLQQVPLQRFVVVPLVPLTEIAAHEQQLLTGMRPHVTVREPQVREPLPQVAGHLVQ